MKIALFLETVSQSLVEKGFNKDDAFMITLLGLVSVTFIIAGLIGSVIFLLPLITDNMMSTFSIKLGLVLSSPAILLIAFIVVKKYFKKG